MTAIHPASGHPRATAIDTRESLEEREMIRAEIERLLADQACAVARYSTDAAELWRRIAAALQGGKLTRPRLVGVGYRAFGGGDRQRALALACAFEFLHGSLLMHDDVIDRDFTRRGKPTLSAGYRDLALAAGKESNGAEHVGNSAAIIAGDLLLSLAIRRAAQAAAGLPCAEAVASAFELGIAQAGAGELEDLLFSVREVPANTSEVLRMQELKTAGYSFQLPLVCGALLAGASEVEASGLGEIGCRLGVAYQVVDDVLGCFGDPRSTGKSAESDLREGKSTVLTALAGEDPDFRRELRALRRGAGDIDAARRILHRSGAVDMAYRLASELCNAAVHSERFTALPSDTQQELQAFAGFILERTA